MIISLAAFTSCNGETATEPVYVTVSYESGTEQNIDSEQKEAGKAYGALPMPQREDYTFGGWYTREEYGERVTEETTVAQTQAHTLYAKWNYAGKIVAVSAGATFSLALGEDGVIRSWGEGNWWQLGNGDNIGDPNYPLRPWSKAIPSEAEFVQIAAGRDHSLALDKAGNIWGWGYGNYVPPYDNGSLVRLVPVARATNTALRSTARAAFGLGAKTSKGSCATARAKGRIFPSR